MGNTCGCVDPAEKDGEVKVENNKLRNTREAQINNYRDSTISKNQNQYNASTPIQAMDGLPHLFDTDDQYLIDLQRNAVS